jgi:hypothetical protein
MPKPAQPVIDPLLDMVCLAEDTPSAPRDNAPQVGQPEAAKAATPAAATPAAPPEYMIWLRLSDGRQLILRMGRNTHGALLEQLATPAAAPLVLPPWKSFNG